MGSKWRAYFELLRFPAVFTAVADVMMGYLVTHGDLKPIPLFALLVAASSSMYLAGMVLNDLFDIDADTLERPGRPIPSGRIAPDSAARLGWCLLAGGLCFAWLVSILAGNWSPGVVGSLLATAIVLYDALLKRTLIAPVAMGACRVLNVLLAMSLATADRGHFGFLWEPTYLTIALGIGVYITGLTWFARGEAIARPNRVRLLSAILVMLCGFAVLAFSGRIELRPAHFFTESNNWPLLWLALAMVIIGRCVWAAWRHEPRATQIAVRTSIRALIMIDAALVLGFCGAAWGWAVLALLIPMLLLERWASTT